MRCFPLSATTHAFSGTGLCGLAASLLGASSTKLTDINSLQNLNETNKASFIKTLQDARTPRSSATYDDAIASLTHSTFSSYFWGTDLPRDLKLPDGEFYDVVIASDDLYDDDAFPPLLESLNRIVGDNTLVLFSYKRRMDKREVPFFEKLTKELLNLYVISAEVLQNKYAETYVILGAKKSSSVDKSMKKK